jgi:4-hydroxy-3-polyprenylbenzoate decarboxylase
VSTTRRSITVGITGGSGSVYALRLLPILARHYGRVDVVMSNAARQVLDAETSVDAPQKGRWDVPGLGDARGEITVWPNQEYRAPFASGSNCAEQMVIVPCSMSTLASIALGIDQNLLHHAAAVTIKERKQLVVVPRETPLSAIHLRNMLALAELGVAIVPAMPGFYGGERTFDDLIAFVLQKIVNQLGLDERLRAPWGGDDGATTTVET